MTTKFDDNTSKAVFAMISKYAESNEWLKTLNLARINYYWTEGKSSMKSGVMGKFSVFKPNNIYIMDYYNATDYYSRLTWLTSIFPVIIHELRHMYQFKSNPITFFLGMFWSRITDWLWDYNGFNESNHLLHPEKMSELENFCYTIRRIGCECDADIEQEKSEEFAKQLSLSLAHVYTKKVDESNELDILMESVYRV